MLIQITDEIKRFKKESFINGKFVVFSRSGLNIAEKKFITLLPKIGNPKNILILENRTGVSAIIATNLFPDAKIRIQTIDIFYINKMKKRIKDYLTNNIELVCAPYIDQMNNYDLIFYQISAESVPKELTADLIQNCHKALKQNGKLIIATDSHADWLKNNVKKIFGSFSFDISKHLTSVIAKKRNNLKKIKNHKVNFEMTVLNKKKINLSSIPGVFAHRRVDIGAQALSEVVEVKENDRVLDMGCGCGSIGIFLAKNYFLDKITFLDASSRATFCTEENCTMNQIENYEMILSDNGLERQNGFTLFVGNPPYFSHHKISKLFIDTAFDSLEQNGRAYIVAKTAKWHLNYMADLFGNAELIERRGYQIVKSIKMNNEIKNYQNQDRLD